MYQSAQLRVLTDQIGEVSMNEELHRVKGNILEFRLGLNVDCVVSTTYCSIWPQIHRKRQRREWWRVLVSVLFGALFRSKSAHCLFLFMQKLFSTERLTHRKLTDPSNLKPSIQDQVAMNTSNLRNCLSHFINYPPNSALLTDFFIKTSPLMNESVFPLSVRVNHPPTLVSLHFQNSQFVPGTFPNIRHYPGQARCLMLNVQLF